MKTYKNQPAPFMVGVVEEFLDLLYWRLNRVLDREGISMLQWAFMQRALNVRDGVPFSQMIEATRESKDNVRRAAASLGGFATIEVDPKDRRARELVLTKRGRRRALKVSGRFEKELLTLIGARLELSQRAEEFRFKLWDASAYLAPGDMADKKTIRRSEENRLFVPDDSLRFQYIEDDGPEPAFAKDEPDEDSIPF
jgi:DNA-binding MarR family transcriptional regulator